MTDVVSETVSESAVLDADAAFGESRGARSRYVARRLLHSKSFVLGAVILGFWVVMAFSWPLVVPHDPQEIDALHVLSPPSATYWLGTDSLGRDVFSRTLAGCTTVLLIATASTILSIIVGTLIGLLSGYLGGLVDEVAMRAMDILLAFPIVIIAVLILGLLGSSAVNVILVITILFAPMVARTVRSAVLAEREREYVDAARMRGESVFYVVLGEILPNITAPIIVEATTRLAYAVFTAATLSFLRLGVKQPSPDWGLTISIERVNVMVYAGSTLVPAIALASLVVSVTLVADAVRQVLSE
jgi:peptide/nickel transport system permease protein